LFAAMFTYGIIRVAALLGSRVDSRLRSQTDHSQTESRQPRPGRRRSGTPTGITATALGACDDKADHHVLWAAKDGEVRVTPLGGDSAAAIREAMKEADVECILLRAREMHPSESPRVISDNGPQFIAKDFIRLTGMTHVRTAPYYPESNGKSRPTPSGLASPPRSTRPALWSPVLWSTTTPSGSTARSATSPPPTSSPAADPRSGPSAIAGSKPPASCAAFAVPSATRR